MNCFTAMIVNNEWNNPACLIYLDRSSQDDMVMELMWWWSQRFSWELFNKVVLDENRSLKQGGVCALGNVSSSWIKRQM